MKKKFISSFLVVMLLSSLILSITAYAQEKDQLNLENDVSSFSGDSGGDVELVKKITLESQRKDVENNDDLSVEQKEAILEKINLAENLGKEDARQALQTPQTRGYMIMHVWPSKQWNNYYCGPATGVQTMCIMTRNLTGNLYTGDQALLAGVFNTTTAGTDGIVMKNKLNDRIRAMNGVGYVVLSPSSEANMRSAVWMGMQQYDMPPILRVNCTTALGWPYTVSGGHFMNVSGCNDNAPLLYPEYEVTDPWIKHAKPANTTGKHWIRSAYVYNSTMNHFAKHFYF